MVRRWRSSLRARPRCRCHAGLRLRWRPGRPCGGAPPGRSRRPWMGALSGLLPSVTGGDLRKLPIVGEAARHRNDPAGCECAERRRPRALLHHCPLSDDRPRTDLCDRLAVDLDRERAVEHQEHLVARSALLYEGVALRDRASLLLSAADDDRPELALERTFHWLNHRGRVVRTPRRALAERVVDPGAEVGQPRLRDELAGVVVNPVTWKAAGSDELPLGVAVGMDRQGQSGPGDRGVDLKERLVAHGSWSRHAGAASTCLSKAHVRFGHDWLGTDVGHRPGLDRQRLRTEVQARHSYASTAMLPPGGYLPVFNLDPAFQLVAFAEKIPAMPLVQIVEPGRQRLVVVGQAHAEGHGQESCDRLEGNPGNRCNRTFKFHLVNLRPA